MGVIAAALATLGGLRVRSHLVEAYGLGPESPRVRAAWMLERAEEFLECAADIRSSESNGTSCSTIRLSDGHGGLHSEQPDCLEIAGRLTRAAIDLDPSRADAHVLAATVEGNLGSASDAILARLDRAVALDPTLREARIYRAHLLTHMYMDRWERMEAGLLLGPDAVRDDPDLCDLRGRIITDIESDPRPVGSADLAEVQLEKARRALWEYIGSPLRLPVVNWAELSKLMALPQSPAVRFRKISSCCPPTVLCDFEDRIVQHGQVVAWETDWWYARWPSYGTKPDLEALAEHDVQRNTPSAAASDAARRRMGAGRVWYLAAKEPDEGISLARRAELLEAQGDSIEALGCADRAVAAIQQAPGVRLLRARIHEDLYNLERARSDYDDAVRLGEGRAEFLRVRASFLLQTGHAMEALEDARRALELDDSAPSVALLGDALVANGRADEALKVLVGDCHPVGGARCRALRALGRAREAQTEAERTHDFIEVALSALDLGTPADAAAAVGLSSKGEQTVPSYARLQNWLHVAAVEPAAICETRARILLALGRLEEALEFADEAILDQPLRATAHAIRAHALLDLGHLPQARASTERAVTINSRCPFVWKIYGRVLEAQGRLEEAEEAYEKAATLDGKDLETQTWLVGVRARMRR